MNAGGLEHAALLYHGADDYAAGCAAFIRRGLAADDPVLTSVPAVNSALVRAALTPAEAAKVQFFDMEEAGRNPGRILPTVMLDFAERHDGDRVWIIGEPIWPGRSSVEYPACVAHEALTNVAFAQRDAAILCPYDTTGLGRQVVNDAWSTHPTMLVGAEAVVSSRYGDPIRTAAEFNHPLPHPPATADRYPFREAGDLRDIRIAVAQHAATAGLSPAATADLQLAINELACNSIEHTPAGSGTLFIWEEPGMVVCQVEDGGHLADPMAGRLTAGPKSVRGRGLILVNTLVDLFRVHTTPAGTSIRVHMHTA